MRFAKDAGCNAAKRGRNSCTFRATGDARRTSRVIVLWQKRQVHTGPSTRLTVPRRSNLCNAQKRGFALLRREETGLGVCSNPSWLGCRNDRPRRRQKSAKGGSRTPCRKKSPSVTFTASITFGSKLVGTSTIFTRLTARYLMWPCHSRCTRKCAWSEVAAEGVRFCPGELFAGKVKTSAID